MKVSQLNGQLAYGIDLSHKGAKVYEISQEDYTKIQNGLAKFLDGAVVDIPEEERPQPQPTWPTFVTISIPLTVKNTDEEVQEIIQSIRDNYWDVWGRTNAQTGMFVMSNINLADVPLFLPDVATLDYFANKWVVFDKKIIDYFEPWEVAQEETQAPESEAITTAEKVIATYTAAVSEEDARPQHTVDEIKEALDYYELPVSGVKEEISLRLYNHIHQ